MQTLTKFWCIFRIVWIERLVYRVNFFLEIVSGILSSLVVVFLWMAVYKSAGRELLGGYSLEEMVTYLLGGGLINTFILTTAENPETSQSIQDGALSNLLVEPISPYAVWFIRDLGSKAFLFLLGLSGYMLVFFFFRQLLLPPADATHILLLLISLSMASLLQFFLFEALSLLSFWVENTYGIRFTMRVIMEVAGGALIPLSFFPGLLQKIFALLPFHFLIYLPMKVYLGKIAPLEIAKGFCFEGAWIAGLAIANWLIWRKGVRQYVSMGD